ncbi:MAG: hypothetical protein MZW92_52905 [Comamonadaceae bacterium]|nr:hypothetical protein [Comamonadaceae bacterium]
MEYGEDCCWSTPLRNWRVQQEQDQGGHQQARPSSHSPRWRAPSLEDGHEVKIADLMIEGRRY